MSTLTGPLYTLAFAFQFFMFSIKANLERKKENQILSSEFFMKKVCF